MTTTPRIYVGTYAKYNSGSIEGKWLDLDDYSDRDEFLEACRELHEDEADPELMFQDFENFPKAFYSESSVSEKLWDWIALDDDDRELVEVYAEAVGYDADEVDLDQARDAFGGKFKDEEDWAYEFLESTGSLEEIPENLRNYFDFAAYARDAGHDGTTFHYHNDDCWVFYAR